MIKENSDLKKLGHSNGLQSEASKEGLVMLGPMDLMQEGDDYET